MSICILAAGLSFYIPNDQTAHNGLIAFFLFLFAALYSPGLGPMPFTVASEAFPLSHREVGVAVSVGVNLFVAGLLTMFYPRLDSALGHTGSLGLFAGLNILAAIMIFLWVPETKQRSLEELDLVFAVPTKKFMRYQVKEFLPWAVKRYLLGRDIPLQDLYEDRIWNPVEEKADRAGDELHADATGPRSSSIDCPQHVTVEVARMREKPDASPRTEEHERVQAWNSRAANDHMDMERASISSSVGTHD